MLMTWREQNRRLGPDIAPLPRCMTTRGITFLGDGEWNETPTVRPPKS
ncbi:hypothetical protein R5H32_15165 [Defluviimonas sp. D31]|nr:hypothetical protein [Defluviimonas sp. D31]MDW4550700.1 hypothetical protein [Defluviimonas sp. D31]